MHTAPWLIAIKIFSFSFLLGSYIFLKMDLRSPVSLPSCSLPFLSGSWPLIITLNLILSVSPMTIQFPKANEWSVCILVLFYLPESFGTILFSLVCFFQLTFKTEYFLGFFPCMLELHFDLYFCIFLFSLTFKIEDTLSLVHKTHSLNTTYILIILKFVSQTLDSFVIKIIMPKIYLHHYLIIFLTT